MKFGGLVPFSLNDFPGRDAAVLFTQGCNFRCPFCHNGELIPVVHPAGREIAPADVDAFLRSRRGQLDGVVISGGEPTIQEDLKAFIGYVKDLGFEVKLDTNGSRPDVLRSLFDTHWLDYVAMDVKAPPFLYPRLTGVTPSLAAIAESIRLIAASGVPHQFRTTHVPSLLGDEDLDSIRAMLPPDATHCVQPFVAHHAWDVTLREPVPAMA